MNLTSAHDLGETANGIARKAADTAAQAMRSTRHAIDETERLSRQLQRAALRASDRTVDYIRDEPVRSVALAAAAGAAMAALAWILTQSLRSRHR